MPALATVTAALESIAPLRLAADWDAVGLLMSPRRPALERVMTCLTLTEDVAAEAVRRGADLVVSHHPLTFRPVARLTDESHVGRVLLALAGAGTGVWSPHTAWDSAAGGINDQLAVMLGLAHVAPLEPDAELPLVGFGRAGTAPEAMTVAGMARRVGAALRVRHVQLVGAADRPAGRVGIVCGSGGDCIPQVVRGACDTLLTGEIKLHQAIEAAAAGLAVVAVGHHASERFSMAVLAERLTAAVPGLECWASEVEQDPLGWLEVG
ncbi:MAG: Nif3-like dinuclear metal center hexameric protein [Planctomycetaceae bacterium]|nr:Nif3-like dinuclear metal center hexameric protein [Planctomycetaceae bacterium]